MTRPRQVWSRISLTVRHLVVLSLTVVVVGGGIPIEGIQPLRSDLSRLAQSVGLTTSWAMFAPDPRMSALHLDVHTWDDEAPASVHAVRLTDRARSLLGYRGDRWRKLAGGLSSSEASCQDRRHFARRWLEQHPLHDHVSLTRVTVSRERGSHDRRSMETTLLVAAVTEDGLRLLLEDECADG